MAPLFSAHNHPCEQSSHPRPDLTVDPHPGVITSVACCQSPRDGKSCHGRTVQRRGQGRRKDATLGTRASRWPQRSLSGAVRVGPVPVPVRYMYRCSLCMRCGCGVQTDRQ